MSCYAQSPDGAACLVARLYNTESWECYRPPSFEDEHSGPVVKVLSASHDGCLSQWLEADGCLTGGIQQRWQPAHHLLSSWLSQALECSLPPLLEDLCQSVRVHTRYLCSGGSCCCDPCCRLPASLGWCLQFSSNDQYVLVSSLVGKLVLLDLDKGADSACLLPCLLACSLAHLHVGCLLIVCPSRPSRGQLSGRGHPLRDVPRRVWRQR